jgi:succinate dehydrogenase / fumarate reductase flavoprotein subunit
MFDSVPENYRAQTADNEEEGWRYCQGDKDARRPPELLTRDHIARCIVREIKEGRGSPHGGVFLDIAWIEKKLPNAAEHIKKKLPSMYHQFKQLADIDITNSRWKSARRRYVMGGIRVDSDTQMSRVRDSLRQVNAPLELTVPIDWAGIRCLIFWFSDSAPAICR